MVDITGMKYGRLTVIEKTNIKQGDKYLWKCLCDCQKDLSEEKRKYTYATKSNLDRGISDKKGGTLSCGCFHKEQSSINGKNNKKYNRYDMTSFEYGVGFTKKNEEFYFDKEDYELIYQYCWHRHQGGYMRTCDDHYYDENNKRHNHYIMIHQLLRKKYNWDENLEIDHINGIAYDNRKSNLRLVTRIDNMKNVKTYVTNSSGVKGVSYNINEKKWTAYITYNKKRMHLGTYEKYNDAVFIRKYAEYKLFGKYNRNQIGA